MTTDRYDQMTNEELERHVRQRGVPSGPRETFPGRQIIQWLRLRDRDDADAERFGSDRWSPDDERED